MLGPAEYEAMVPFPVGVIMAIPFFSDQEHICAAPYGGFLSYIREIRGMAVQGGNEVWCEFL